MSGFDPARFAELAERCEQALRPSSGLDRMIGEATGVGARAVRLRGQQLTEYPSFTASLDAAMGLLEPGNDWRRLTPVSMSVFAASPYNAAAQVRYDGYGATPALQLCAAVLKMRFAKLKLRASADTHPKDGDAKQAPLVSGAVPEGQTPNA